jgi:4-methylaminobutanoate oxidase (formaldehyde-forming)
VASDLGWVRRHAPCDGSVQVREVTDDFACIGLWGPAARDTLTAVTPSELGNAAFPYMTARVIAVGGIEAWAQRVTYVGELGWELYLRCDQAGAVWDALLAAGQPFGIAPAGYKAVDGLRLEKAYRYWSSDVTPADNPLEAGLGFCARLDKGDFIGREALLQIKALGLARKLCTVTVRVPSPELVLYGGEPVSAGGRVVGRLRSAGYGYTVEQYVGLAYLPVALATPGTALEVEVFGERAGAAVAPDVLWDPSGTRIRR